MALFYKKFNKITHFIRFGRLYPDMNGLFKYFRPLLLLIIPLNILHAGENFYVAVNGSDDWSGRLS